MKVSALAATNRLLERWIIVILPVVLFAGFQASGALERYVPAVPFLFMYLTFVSSINVTKEQFAELRSKPWTIVILLALVHAATPWLSYGVLSVLYGRDNELMLGALLAMILPIGVTAIVWVTMSRGSTGIAIGMVTLDTLLSPLLLPLTLWLLLGTSVSIDAAGLIWGVVKLVVLPCLAGMLVGIWLRRKDRQTLRLSLGLSSKLTLYVIVLLNAAAMAASITQLAGEVVKLVLTVGGLMVMGYALSWAAMRAMKLGSGAEIALTYSGGVRNYTAGIVIAQLYFTPQAAIPVMIAMLLQHPLALFVHFLFSRLKQAGTRSASSASSTA
ncbi:bile acid:sodium symporter family protein [Paenibacillus sp. J2TS4]|uniref:bile acid:sodium symporter family protein n=1 Tax=Paenibacillus sp. J2TS4 TaxID=2807194 RepID=UPI001B2B2DEF|nr:bile acid:sodium symporter [Paenibacillus sp. J2TS4]GIP31553.1 sodium transporter [Paenibacillus sp. J2TS4]